MMAMDRHKQHATIIQQSIILDGIYRCASPIMAVLHIFWILWILDILWCIIISWLLIDGFEGVVDTYHLHDGRVVIIHPIPITSLMIFFDDESAHTKNVRHSLSI